MNENGIEIFFKKYTLKSKANHWGEIRTEEMGANKDLFSNITLALLRKVEPTAPQL